MQVLEEKKFFRIGEVSRIIGVEPYVLRYWKASFRRSALSVQTRTNEPIRRKIWN